MISDDLDFFRDRPVHIAHASAQLSWDDLHGTLEANRTDPSVLLAPLTPGLAPMPPAVRVEARLGSPEHPRSSAQAEVRGLQAPYNLTFFWAGWQKIVAQIRGVFRKMIYYYPLGAQIFAPKHVFTPIFVFTPSPRAPVCGAL